MNSSKVFSWSWSGKSANKIRCENNMHSGNKNEWTFWVNKQVSALSTTKSDAQIIYRTTPYIQHEQIKLNGLYKQFLETAFWLRKNAFKTGLQKLLLKKSYELVLGLRFYATNFVLQIDNWIGLKFTYSLTKATNTLGYLIDIM